MAEKTAETRGLTGRFAPLAIALVLLSGLAGPRADTAAAQTAVRPVVLGWAPGITRHVPPASALTVFFNRAMDRASVKRAWRLLPATPGSFDWSATGTAATFVPAHPWRAGASYRLTIGAGAHDGDGSALVPFQLAFATGDTLRVVSFTPAPGTRAVPASGLIAVTFNHPMVSLSGLTATTPNPPGWRLTLQPQAGSSMTPAGRWLGTSTWIFSPQSMLQPSTRYTVTLQGTVRDSWGDVLGHDLRWTFRTVTPEVIAESPGSGAHFVDPRRPVKVAFNQPMNHASAAAAFSLRRMTVAGVAPVAGQITWDGDTLVFQPDQPFTSRQPYLVTVAAAARSANGRATLGRQVHWHFQAAPPPRLVATVPHPGDRSAAPHVEFHFSAPMNQKSLDHHLSIKPALQTMSTSLWGPTQIGDFVYTIDGDFQPSQRYTVRIGRGVVDRYGRPLPGALSLSFTTAPLPSSVALYGVPGSGEGISFSAGRVIAAPVQLVNVRQVRYTLIRTTLPALAASTPQDVPPAGTSVRTWTVSTPHPLNTVENLGVPLRQRDGSPLAPGLYWLGAEDVHGEDASSEFVVATNVGMTEKNGGNGTLVWVTSAQSGKPLPHAPVRLYDYQGHVIAASRTNAQGLHLFHHPPNQGYPTAEVKGNGYFGLTEGYWQPALLPSGPFSPFIGYPGGYGPSGGSYAYTDRPIYRPGQRVHFRAVLWRDDDGVYSLLGPRTAVVTAQDSRGRQLYHARLTLDRFGAVHGSFALPRGAPTGFGQISITVPHGRSPSAQTYVGFTVAEYRKPEFLTQVTAAHPGYIQGQTLTARVQVRYLFGAPVSRQPVTWTACAQPLVFSPPGWDGYSFFDWESYWQQPGTQPGNGPECANGRLVGQGRGQTDAAGRLAIHLPVNLRQELLDQTITVEATTSDINHQAVSGRTAVPVYKAGFGIGLAAEHRVLPVEQQATVAVAAVQPNGKPVANQALTARIYRRTYTTKLGNSGNGWSNWESVPHDTLLGTRQLTTDADGKTSLSFTPTTGGEYRVVVDGYDASHNPIGNAISIYASAAGFSDWGQSDSTAITLTADQSSYRVGETAHVLVAAPFDHATALVTVERGTIRSTRVEQLASNSATVAIPITLDDLPNVYVSVTIYRGWRNGSPPDWRSGTVELRVALDPRHVIVHLTQPRRRYHPGERIAYTIATTDSRDRPVSAQLSLALVDTAVLALQSQNAPNILAALYGERPLGVSTASDGVISIDHLQEKPSGVVPPTNVGGVKHAPAATPAPVASRAGGGGGGGAPITVRSHFADTAYWAGAVVTDQRGRATLRLRLPDNTTTWRLDARAVTTGQGVGQAQVMTLSTKDIIVRPVTPRFFLQGDSLQVGAVVNNTLGYPVQAIVSLAASGLTLVSGRAVSLRLPAHGERLALWPVRVPPAHLARLTIQAVPRSGNLAGDAVRVRIPVDPPLTDETVATSGQVMDSIRQEVIVPRGAVSQPGALTVQISSSLTAGLGAALAGFQPARYESNEDIADRVLVASALRSLPPPLTGLSRAVYARLPLLIAAGVQKLADNQLGDGGWPWFNGPFAQSDPAITADAVQALAAAGPAERVQRHVLAAGRAYLRGQLATVPAALRAHLLAVLAEAGQPDRLATLALYRNTVRRSHLPAAGLADLALALRLAGAPSPAQSLVATLDSRAMVSATGAHWEGGGWSYFAQPAVTTTTAVLTALLRLAPHDPFVPAAARWLMLARSGSAWDCPPDTAQAVATLAAYARAAHEGQAAYRYQVLVDGSTRLTGRYTPASRRRVAELAVPVAHLPRTAPSSLVVARQPDHGTLGPGPLYYLMRLRYFLPARAIAPRDAGLSVGRAYLDARGKPITTAAAGSVVAVKLTIRSTQTLTYLDVEDPLPSGLEPIDQSLNTSQQALPTPGRPANPWLRPDLSWYLVHTDIRDDRVALFASYLPPGSYTYTYLARATVSGSYSVAPTHAAETFFPEVFGRSAGQVFTIR